MKLNLAERWLVNNPARALVQRFHEVPLLRRLGGIVESGQVLEVGCGRGVGLPLLLTQFKALQVIGIDIDPEQVRRAKNGLRDRYKERIDLHVASVERLPFSDARFDAVFDFGILHHVPAWQSAVAEIARVLKPGGTFFFEEVTSAALERWSYRTAFTHPKENRFDEIQFLDVLRTQKLRPGPEIRRVMFGDIFIGVAKRC